MGGVLSSESESNLQLDARLEAYEHLLRHLIVTVLARTQDPMDTFEGFQRRIMAPLRRRAIKDPAAGGAASSDALVVEIVEWIAKGVGEELQHALNQVGVRRR